MDINVERNTLIKDFKILTKFCFEAIEPNEKADLLSFGLSYMPYIEHISFSYNTKSHYLEEAKDFIESDRDEEINVEIAMIDFKYALAEWKCDLGLYYKTEQKIDLFNKKLSEFSGYIGRLLADDTLFNFCIETTSMMVDVMVELKNEGLFKNMNDDFFVYVGQDNFEVGEHDFIMLHKLLNDQQFEEFSSLDFG